VKDYTKIDGLIGSLIYLFNFFILPERYLIKKSIGININASAYSKPIGPGERSGHIIVTYPITTPVISLNIKRILSSIVNILLASVIVVNKENPTLCIEHGKILKL